MCLVSTETIIKRNYQVIIRHCRSEQGNGTPRRAISCFRSLFAIIPGEAILPRMTALVEALRGKKNPLLDKPVLQIGFEINSLLKLAGQGVCLRYR